MSVALMRGAYCRSGETGRGQLWLDGKLLGVAGPKALRLLREDPSVQEGTLTSYGIARRAYRAVDQSLHTPDGDWTFEKASRR